MQKEQNSQISILNKLGVSKLNPMQELGYATILDANETVLLSPTGTGKTLAFLLPIVTQLDPNSKEVQVIVLAPSRELAIQIESVARQMGTGFKTNAVYGGRLFTKDKQELKHPPAILVGTPGRVADHLRRNSFATHEIKTLVLDEFDKSLEIGFSDDMSEIISLLPSAYKKVLTSATQGVEIPGFVKIKKPTTLNFLDQENANLEVKIISSPQKDKLETLLNGLRFVGNKPGIVFCNFKETIGRVSDFLNTNGIKHGIFHGGMEQRDRERSLIKFRNGTYHILLATDLAARGIDVPEIQYIMHYHLPHKKEEFTHRNGRTARMNKGGTAYVIAWEEEQLPDFIEALYPDAVDVTGEHVLEDAPTWSTLFVSGGRKDKISKGDLAGAFFKVGKLKPNELGTIELKTDCAFVSVPEKKVKQVIQNLNNTRIKKRKVRVSLA